MLRRSRKCSNNRCLDRYLLKKFGKGKYKCIRCGAVVAIPDKKLKKEA